MVELIFLCLFTLLILFLLFSGLCKIVMLWTGVSKKEARKKVQDFFSNKTEYHLAMDSDLYNLIEISVKGILGERRFSDLCKLAPIAPLIGYDYASGLPRIYIVVPYNDDNEKKRIEQTLKQLVMRFLRSHGLCDAVMVDWREHPTLNLPFIMLRYAESADEENIIKKCLNEECGDILGKFAPLKDDEEVLR